MRTLIISDEPEILGKTTIANLLADKFECPVFELSNCVVKKSRKKYVWRSMNECSLAESLEDVVFVAESEKHYFQCVSAPYDRLIVLRGWV